MARSEVFTNPTVRKVTFQLKFPNLFAMESMIGAYQGKIMAKFPASKLLVRRPFVFASVAMPAAEQSDGQKVVSDAPEDPTTNKIWNFSSDDDQKVILNITNDSLDISSVAHKTYESEPAGDGFRDRIEHAVDSFISVTGIPLFLRIGLRYEDDGPLPSTPDSKEFAKYYKSTFPLDRFPWEDAKELVFAAQVKRNNLILNYRERLKQVEDRWRYTLDYDGCAERIQAGDFLPVTDKLHQLIASEFKATIKEPVREWMRRTDHPERQQ